MPLLASKELCNGCESCLNACSRHAIQFKLDTHGFFYPSVDETLCVECGICSKRCPVIDNTILPKVTYNDTIAYGAYIKEQKEIRKSASGGLAYALARNVITQGGTVYGVIYQNDFRDIIYARASTLEQFQPMRGSKYVQARKGNVYQEIRSKLKNNEKVLFIGLPCEVGGLYAFLSRHYSTLLTVELICAGVGSYFAHRGFLDKMQLKENAKIVDFTYRYKKRGWVPCYISIDYSNGHNYNYPFSYTSLGSCIEKYKRPSCYHCIYKSDKRCADITIGDFWTLNPLHPAYNHWGTSVVFPRTDKGLKIIEGLQDIRKIQVDRETALRSNQTQLTTNGSPYDKRKELQQVLLDEGMVGVENKFTPRMKVSQKIIERIPGNIYFYVKKIGYFIKSFR